MLRPWAPNCGSAFAPDARNWRTSASMCSWRRENGGTGWFLVQLHPNSSRFHNLKQWYFNTGVYKLVYKPFTLLINTCSQLLWLFNGYKLRFKLANTLLVKVSKGILQTCASKIQELGETNKIKGKESATGTSFLDISGTFQDNIYQSPCQPVGYHVWFSMIYILVVIRVFLQIGYPQTLCIVIVHHILPWQFSG